jgi:hypothetical protein
MGGFVCSVGDAHRRLQEIKSLYNADEGIISAPALAVDGAQQVVAVLD